MGDQKTPFILETWGKSFYSCKLQTDCFNIQFMKRIYISLFKECVEYNIIFISKFIETSWNSINHEKFIKDNNTNINQRLFKGNYWYIS